GATRRRSSTSTAAGRGEMEPGAATCGGSKHNARIPGGWEGPCCAKQVLRIGPAPPSTFILSRSQPLRNRGSARWAICTEESYPTPLKDTIMLRYRWFLMLLVLS